MKKVLFLVSIAGMTLLLSAANVPGSWVKNSPKTVSCGYRIIEFGVGVDCNGDTVKLVKSKGFQRLATADDEREVLPNSLIFGGAAVAINVTDCTSKNSPDGKSRAIAAINSSGDSMCTIQFGVPDPAAGAYITVMEEPIGTGQVLIGVGGPSFGGAFIAAAGQTIAVTYDSLRYRASFKDIVLIEPLKKEQIGKKITGDFGCE
jgi:hypothetical protein